MTKCYTERETREEIKEKSFGYPTLQGLRCQKVQERQQANRKKQDKLQVEKSSKAST